MSLTVKPERAAEPTEVLLKLARQSVKRTKVRPVRIPVVCERIGLGKHGSEVDTKQLRAARRRLYLAIKDGLDEQIVFVKGSAVDVA